MAKFHFEIEIEPTGRLKAIADIDAKGIPSLEHMTAFQTFQHVVTENCLSVTGIIDRNCVNTNIAQAVEEPNEVEKIPPNAEIRDIKVKENQMYG